MNVYDVIIIGGGPCGYKSAELLCIKKKKVLLIEEDVLGGVCLNQGCIPFKTYLHYANIYKSIKKIEKDAIINRDVGKLSQNRILDIKQQIVLSLRQSLEGMLKRLGVDILYGHAELHSEKGDCIEVSVNSELYKSSYIILATGSEEIEFPVQNQTEYNVLTSKEMLLLDAIPNDIDIIGAGAVGLEAACYFASNGCNVTVIDAAKRIGGHIDAEISESFERILSKQGINILTNTSLKSFDRKAVNYEKDGELLIRSPSYVLLSIGRKPRLDIPSFEKFGIKFDNKGIIVDNHCRTSHSRIFAGGDVTGKLMLAHVAYQQAKVIVDAIFGGDASVEYELAPRIIYSNPEILSVGLTEEDCKANDIPYVVKSLPMTYSGKYFAENGKDGGKAKLLIDAKENSVIGFHMIGNGVDEISLAAEIIISKKMKLNEISNLFFPHPTYGEIISDLVWA